MKDFLNISGLYTTIRENPWSVVAEWLLIGLVMVIGVRVIGSLMVTALLVLPGASALLVSRRLHVVIALSLATALIGAIVGLLLNARWSYLPIGPAIVLTLVAQFVVAYAVGRSGRVAAT